MNKSGKKEVIETMINTTALAFTSFAVIEITTKQTSIIKPIIILTVGMFLEFVKYSGRAKKLW